MFNFTVAIPCQSNQECAAGYTCTEGLCLLGCKEDAACAMNERCLQGKCLCTKIYRILSSLTAHIDSTNYNSVPHFSDLPSGQ